jgi:hypothetical protein
MIRILKDRSRAEDSPPKLLALTGLASPRTCPAGSASAESFEIQIISYEHYSYAAIYDTLVVVTEDVYESSME